MDESIALLRITYHRLSNLSERRFNILVGSGPIRQSRDSRDLVSSSMSYSMSYRMREFAKQPITKASRI